MTEKHQKNIQIFICKLCDFKCSKRGDWNRHVLRPKHLQVTLGDKQVTKKTSHHKCSGCEKIYASRNGLWKHKQTCLKLEDEHTYQGINLSDKDALVMHLLKQNGDLQQKIMAMGMQPTITNNNNHTITNNSFNLNLFLNETCKHAMNINDFVSNMKIDLDDLENTGRTGYIEGISNIIIKNLNKLEQHLRPLHCSDAKREILYIKDNDEWTKESNDKPILTKAIKTIANENIKLISKWKDNYPDCVKSDSNKNDLYLKIVSNSMNGLTKDESEKNIHKIISNVSKQVVIEK
jgi:hypothetical protein